MAHIGLYSGTFDPLHQGHISFALKAAQVCRLSSIVLLPESTPRNKDPVESITNRVRFISRDISDIPILSVRKLSSTQFTIIPTLLELRQLYPNDHFTFLFGSDVARHLSTWPDIEILLSSSNLAVGMRLGDDEKLFRKSIDDLRLDTKTQFSCHFISTPFLGISSTMLKT